MLLQQCVHFVEIHRVLNDMYTLFNTFQYKSLSVHGQFAGDVNCEMTYYRESWATYYQRIWALISRCGTYIGANNSQHWFYCSDDLWYGCVDATLFSDWEELLVGGILYQHWESIVKHLPMWPAGQNQFQDFASLGSDRSLELQPDLGQAGVERICNGC